ncbi:MAG: hypothetical protein IH950_12140 [Bacteroidetes bacterium]|nr:hypothetical protein [Bacteroidota bacterium]
MKKYTLLIIVFVSIALLFTISQEKNIDPTQNDSITDELYEHPKFKRWINFWELKIPELQNFIIENTETLKWRPPHKVKLDGWIQEREIRKYSLNFSAKKDYVVDIYSNFVFEYGNDTIHILGGDIDASFQIVNLTDSVRYWYTEGPYAFFDESIWLSDSICYILGFIIDANAGGYCKVMIIMWDFSRKLLVRFRSQEFPLYKEYIKVRTYMNYLYPEFK